MEDEFSEETILEQNEYDMETDFEEMEVDQHKKEIRPVDNKEEIPLEEETKPEIVYVCSCVCPHLPPEKSRASEHRKRILGIVTKTENYLRERRIPQLIRFLLSKLLAEESDKPFLYLEKLLDDCMLFRAGIGVAPVLFENRENDELRHYSNFGRSEVGFLVLERTILPMTEAVTATHIEAVVKSFDPGQRGWLTPGQIRRLYTTLGLPVKDKLEETMSCEAVLNNIIKDQENELFELLSTGMS